mmetsp:Transcript_22/g.30  ORF Transcript_22/g.30 Transcript_22/m.30 type:complete len:136 (+) Transcript_22:81-488(+)|eukprot:CAMPEP_0171463494 /NCGR_PEP_ID=MMETSP0945-20130129/7148_1 /TAXON_ID=109269 /ORGANISM="Vaucheria litorea, Strain CCMP2940" /LENGTH=135 /DNA_ID=CAMNT_0011990309 /DNA_START=76 /DNA_END=483 /DNA_ORIENTATION=-
MAVPPSDAWIQDMPPRGGYPIVNFAKNVPSRGPPGWAMWLGVAAVVGYGFNSMINTNKRKNAVARENREARMNILPYLLAETDKTKSEMKKRFLKEEEKVMGNVLGWKIGESVYKSGIYMDPVVNNGWPNDLYRE